MKVGFTGTRRGMTDEQKATFERYLGGLCIQQHQGQHQELSRSEMRRIERQSLDTEYLELHHGCCVGADTEAHEIYLQVMLIMGRHSRETQIVCHPPKDTKHLDKRWEYPDDARPFYGANYFTGPDRALKTPIRYMERMLHPRPYLDRNHDIVDATDVLIAVPNSVKEELRSGTWATIRYAKRTKQPLMVIPPDGHILTLQIWRKDKDNGS